MKKTAFVLPFGLSQVSSAQTPSSPGPSPQSPAAVPLDGGVSLLLVSGATYAWRRLRKQH